MSAKEPGVQLISMFPASELRDLSKLSLFLSLSLSLSATPFIICASTGVKRQKGQKIKPEMDQYEIRQEQSEGKDCACT